MVGFGDAKDFCLGFFKSVWGETSLGLQLVFVCEGKKLRMGWWVVGGGSVRFPELFVLDISSIFFSMEPPWSVNTFLQSFSQPRL
jgi:hypothetical protein